MGFGLLSLPVLVLACQWMSAELPLPRRLTLGVHLLSGEGKE